MAAIDLVRGLSEQCCAPGRAVLGLGDDAPAVYRYFEHLVATSAGDLAPGVDVESVVNLLVAVTTGFAQFGATSRATRAHGAAIESFKRLVDGLEGIVVAVLAGVTEVAPEGAHRLGELLHVEGADVARALPIRDKEGRMVRWFARRAVPACCSA